jgi:hypothetical protein
MERVINGRTGELRVSAGFWWAQRRDDGSLTIVEITDGASDLDVMFIGNLQWPGLDEALEHIELLAKIAEPKL